jgi:hypothetical protein
MEAIMYGGDIAAIVEDMAMTMMTVVAIMVTDMTVGALILPMLMLTA